MTDAIDPRLLSEERLREIFNTWRSDVLNRYFCALESHIAAQAEIIAALEEKLSGAGYHSAVAKHRTNARAEAFEEAERIINSRIERWETNETEGRVFADDEQAKRASEMQDELQIMRGIIRLVFKEKRDG